MNREKLALSINGLRHFINGSLGLSRANEVSGFELVLPLLDAVAYNTYVETVSNKADTLYLRTKESITEMTTYAYLAYVQRLADKFVWKDKQIVLAFDYTEEDFFGDVEGFCIHGWTGERGVTGKFKFLTCSIISDEIPEKIPLVSVPILVGHYKSHTIQYLLGLIAPFVGKIDLILFDRGFYDKDLMYELSKSNLPYLIFVPKQKDKQEILASLDDGDHVAINNEFMVNKDKTVFYDENILVFLKQIYDEKSKKKYDWVFATNIEDVALGNIIATYKKRWRIETGFRVQDEAMIKCKSKEMKIRYFLFMFQQMLQTQWVCFYKNEATFKEFLIEIDALCKDIVAHPKRSFGKKSENTSQV